MHEVNPSMNQNISDFPKSWVLKKPFVFGPKRHANDTFCKGSQFGTLYKKGCRFVAPIYKKGCQFVTPFCKGCQIETTTGYPMTRIWHAMTRANYLRFIPTLICRLRHSVAFWQQARGKQLALGVSRGEWEYIFFRIPKSNLNTPHTSCNAPTGTKY